MTHLEAHLEHDHLDIDAARRLAALAEEAGDTVRMRRAYELIIELDPFDSIPHQALGRLAMARDDHVAATREFEVTARHRSAGPRGGARRPRGEPHGGRSTGRGETRGDRGARDCPDLRARAGAAAADRGGRSVSPGWHRGATFLLVVAALALVGAPTARSQTAGQSVGLASEQLDGLDWTFVRIRYSSWEEKLRVFRATYWTDPWAVDGPAAEQNLSRRLGGVTSIPRQRPDHAHARG